MNCAMIMAVGVKRRLSQPSGPCRSSRIDRTRPTTTGGRPNPVLNALIRRLRPGNEATAIHAPIGTPGMMLASVAVMEMSSDCRMMTHVSASPVTSNRIASTKPVPSSLQYSQLSALMLRFHARPSVGQHLLLGPAGGWNEQRPAVLRLAKLADDLLSLRGKEIIGKHFRRDGVDLGKL